MRKINSKKYIYLIVTILVIATLFTSGCAGFAFFPNDGQLPNAEEVIYNVEVKSLAESVQTLSEQNIVVNSIDNSTTNYTVSETASLVADSVVEISVTLSGGSASGSGVLIATDDTKYYIVTNHHVIEGAQTIKVKLTDGTSYTATKVASDEDFDIGVITISKTGIDSNKYKPATIPSDSYSIRVGDTAIAIGNPLGTLGGTVTSGIVSALDRQIEVDGVTMNLLQTDAAINQGNSGGGLFDAHAQLIGIVNAKMMAEGIEGLGFAIPVKIAMSAVTDLITKGYVSGRPAIGVTVLELNSTVKMNNFLNGIETTEEKEQWSAYLNYSDKALGLYIYEVANADSGLKVGDYIERVDGRAVVESDTLGTILSSKKIGDQLTIIVKRQGSTQTLNVTLIERGA